MLGPSDRAPEFELSDLDGNLWAAGEALSAGPLAIVFFKVSCPTCQYTMPFLQRLNGTKKNSAPRLIAVSQDDAESTRVFSKRFGISMPMLIDAAPRYNASNLYRITHVPSTFLIEPDGNIALAFDGFIKVAIEELGKRFGVSPFRLLECVPGSRPG